MARPRTPLPVESHHVGSPQRLATGVLYSSRLHAMASGSPANQLGASCTRGRRSCFFSGEEAMCIAGGNKGGGARKDVPAELQTRSRHLFAARPRRNPLILTALCHLTAGGHSAQASNSTNQPGNLPAPVSAQQNRKVVLAVHYPLRQSKPEGTAGLTKEVNE